MTSEKLLALIGKRIISINTDDWLQITLEDGTVINISYDGGYLPDVELNEEWVA